MQKHRLAQPWAYTDEMLLPAAYTRLKGARGSFCRERFTRLLRGDWGDDPHSAGGRLHHPATAPAVHAVHDLVLGVPVAIGRKPTFRTGSVLSAANNGHY